MAKQHLGLTANFEVLPQDLCFVLGLVQKSVNLVNLFEKSLTIVPMITRFGQKYQGTLDNSSWLNPDKVEDISAHFGLNIRAREKDTHVLWSRFGLQGLMGFSCNTFTCLGMHETVNVQTTLNGKPVDVNRLIMDLFDPSLEITFVQLYTPSPHVKYQMRHFHPVRGLITLMDIQHQKTLELMRTEGHKYWSHIDDMERKLGPQLEARLEVV